MDLLTRTGTPSAPRCNRICKFSWRNAVCWKFGEPVPSGSMPVKFSPSVVQLRRRSDSNWRALLSSLQNNDFPIPGSNIADLVVHASIGPIASTEMRVRQGDRRRRGVRECQGKKRLVQRHGLGGNVLPAAPLLVESALRSPGESLDTGPRATMELAFGYDFSNVRIHCGGAATAAAEAVDAAAFTIGRDIVFPNRSHRLKCGAGCVAPFFARLRGGRHECFRGHREHDGRRRQRREPSERRVIQWPASHPLRLSARQQRFARRVREEPLNRSSKEFASRNWKGRNPSGG